MRARSSSSLGVAARHHDPGRVSRAERRGARPRSRSSPGPATAKCTSDSRAADIRELREDHPGVDRARASRMPAGGRGGGGLRRLDRRHGRLMFVSERPARVVLLTECSMSDNVAVQYPDVEFVRPCDLCPHMKRITLRNIRRALETLQDEVDDRRRLRARAPRGRTDAGAVSAGR